MPFHLRDGERNGVQIMYGSGSSGKHRKLVPTGLERMVWTRGERKYTGNVRHAVRQTWRTYMLGKLYAPGPLLDVRRRNADLCRTDVGLWRTLALNTETHCERGEGTRSRLLYSDEAKRHRRHI